MKLLFYLVCLLAWLADAKNIRDEAWKAAFDQKQQVVFNPSKMTMEDVLKSWLDDYDGCIEQPGKTYFTLVVEPFAGVNVHYGLCLPSTWIIPHIQEMAYQIFGKIIEVYEPHEHREENWTLFPILLLLMAVITLLALLSVVVSKTSFWNESVQDHQESEPRNSKNKLGLVVLCFSLEKNFRKLVAGVSEGSNDLRIFHGVRVIAWVFITFLHVLIESLRIPSENIGDKSFSEVFMAPIVVFMSSSANYMVDIFFFISAFLAANFMTKHRHQSGSLNIITAWTFRALRILPSIGFLLLFTMASYEAIGEGPAYPTLTDHLIGEWDIAWKNIMTFTRSLYPFTIDYKCHDHLWFLSVDMVYYIFIPLFVILYFRSRRAFYALSAVVVVSNMAVWAYITYHFNIQGLIPFVSKYKYLYHHPWARMGASHIGLVFGIFFFEYKLGKENSEERGRLGYRLFTKLSVIRHFNWLSFGLLTLLFFMQAWFCYPFVKSFPTVHRHEYPLAANMLYNALGRVLIAIGFGLFIVAPVTQTETFWNNALNGKIFTVLSRLTFQVYLIHWTVINWMAGRTRSPWYMSEGNLALKYLQVLIVSFLLAIGTYLAIEAPFGELVSLWIKNDKRQQRKFEPKRRIIRQEETDEASEQAVSDSDEETHLLKSKTA